MNENVTKLTEELRAEIRREAAEELMRLHDSSERTVQPGLYLAALTLDPSRNVFSD